MSSRVGHFAKGVALSLIALAVIAVTGGARLAHFAVDHHAFGVLVHIEGDNAPAGCSGGCCGPRGTGGDRGQGEHDHDPDQRSCSLCELLAVLSTTSPEAPASAPPVISSGTLPPMRIEAPTESLGFRPQAPRPPPTA